MEFYGETAENRAGPSGRFLVQGFRIEAHGPLPAVGDPDRSLLNIAGVFDGVFIPLLQIGVAPKPRGDEFFQSSIIETSKYKNEIPDFYCHHRCDTEYIRDALEPEIAYWNYMDPVFIDAGTGKGKFTFDIEVLIPRAQRLGKNMVILSNRSALSL